MANYFAPEEDTVNALPATINPNLAAQGRNAVARQSTPNYDSVLEYLGLGQSPDTIQQALEHLGLSDKPARMNPNLAAQGASARKFMAPPTSVMDEKYPAFKKSKDQSEQLGMAIDVLSSLIPLAGPAVKGARAVGRFAGPELAQGLENYMVKTGGILPLDVYHGSPHRFPPTANNPLGEFDTAKIGTGEGAQAYGHGLYLAENPTVAGEYAKKLSEPVTTFGGKQISEITNPESKRLAEWIQSNVGVMQFDARHGEANRLFNRLMPEQQAALGKPSVSDAGQLYKVDLPDEQIAKMLDFNKPLKDQNPEIQKALQDLVKTDVLGRPTGISVDPNMNGQWAYERLAGIRGAKYAAEAMRESGIPGIRYLDQGSRAGGGTSNFVVFDPKHMNIIGRE